MNKLLNLLHSFAPAGYRRKYDTSFIAYGALLVAGLILLWLIIIWYQNP